jgi:hypothetical protein
MQISEKGAFCPGCGYALQPYPPAANSPDEGNTISGGVFDFGIWKLLKYEMSGSGWTRLGEEGLYVSPADSYWKAVKFIGKGASDEFWSDLFLWEDGSGYFRVSQATQESGYWGMRDVSDCDWSIKDGTLTLTQPGSASAVICSGVFEGDRLAIEYSGFFGDPFTIIMEQAEIPPYGAQWELPELYGTWRMISYTDADGGPNFANEPDGGPGSIITVHPTGSVDIKLIDNGFGETELSMIIGVYKPDFSRDDIDGGNVWYLYQSGPIWEGCKNEAWHIELSDYNDPQGPRPYWFITYADGRLLLKKTDEYGPNAWPSAFTAEYEYAGGVPEYESPDTAGLGAPEYDGLIDLYRDILSWGGDDAGDLADTISYNIAYELNIADEQRLYELNCSLFEMYGSSFGYAIHDINGDGIPELFILSEDYYDIHAIYTLHDGSPVLVGAYWSRNRCAIDKDGIIYINGSNGAADSFCASWSLIPGSNELQLVEAFEDAYPVYPDNPTKDAGLDFIPLYGPY